MYIFFVTVLLRRNFGTVMGLIWRGVVEVQVLGRIVSC